MLYGRLIIALTNDDTKFYDSVCRHNSGHCEAKFTKLHSPLPCIRSFIIRNINCKKQQKKTLVCIRKLLWVPVCIGSIMWILTKYWSFRFRIISLYQCKIYSSYSQQLKVMICTSVYTSEIDWFWVSMEETTWMNDEWKCMNFAWNFTENLFLRLELTLFQYRFR